jgi:phosphotransferase system HPr-like phosphotransfer protein
MKFVTKVKFETFEKVNQFIRVITNFESDVDLVSGRYVINAKSAMGVYSLDLTKELELNVYEKVEGETEKLVQELRDLGVIAE